MAADIYPIIPGNVPKYGYLLVKLPFTLDQVLVNQDIKLPEIVSWSVMCNGEEINYVLYGPNSDPDRYGSYPYKCTTVPAKTYIYPLYKRGNYEINITAKNIFTTFDEADTSYPDFVDHFSKEIYVDGPFKFYTADFFEKFKIDKAPQYGNLFPYFIDSQVIFSSDYYIPDYDYSTRQLVFNIGPSGTSSRNSTYYCPIFTYSGMASQQASSSAEYHPSSTPEIPGMYDLQDMYTAPQDGKIRYYSQTSPRGEFSIFKYCYIHENKIHLNIVSWMYVQIRDGSYTRIQERSFNILHREYEKVCVELDVTEIRSNNNYIGFSRKAKNITSVADFVSTPIKIDTVGKHIYEFYPKDIPDSGANRLCIVCNLMNATLKNIWLE